MGSPGKERAHDRDDGDRSAGVGAENSVAPRRVKVSRRHPDPPHTKRVTRPSRWGNPHPVGDCDVCGVRHTRAEAVRLYAAELAVGDLLVTVADVRAELAGWNLGCFCDFDGPCHGDVLLAVANGGAA